MLLMGRDECSAGSKKVRSIRVQVPKITSSPELTFVYNSQGRVYISGSSGCYISGSEEPEEVLRIQGKDFKFRELWLLDKGREDFF